MIDENGIPRLFVDMVVGVIVVVAVLVVVVVFVLGVVTRFSNVVLVVCSIFFTNYFIY
jgi:hypothetical protein